MCDSSYRTNCALLSNALPSRAGPHADRSAAAAVMGPYYPRTAVCPLATLTAKGPQACLR